MTRPLPTFNRPAKLPQFIIVGAMKSATTSLHFMLNEHPSIFLPRREIFFFNIDDIFMHAGFFREEKDHWWTWDYEKHFDDYLQWYGDFFTEATEGQVIGEDSTSYLPSKRVAERIHQLLPDCKIVIMLRDPVKRAYSNYWHLVRTGRAGHSFEDTIQFRQNNLIMRGFYEEQVKRYFDIFPREQVRIILFEDFTKNSQQHVDDMQDWLGVERLLDVVKLEEQHSNPAQTPRSIYLQLLHNRCFADMAAVRHHQRHLPGAERPKHKGLRQRWDRFFKEMNLTTKKKYPPMKKHTQAMLQSVYAMENRGLSELIGIDLKTYWPWMDQ